MAFARALYSIRTRPRAVKSPHFESGSENAAPGKELIETRHGVETIARDLVLLIETIVGAIFDRAAVKQLLALDAAVEARLRDLIRSPHTHCYLRVHRQLDRIFQAEVLPR